MDLLRSTIKTFFYDYPLEAVANYVIEGKDLSSDVFFCRSAELMKWREPRFTSSESIILQNVLEDIWMVDDAASFPKGAIYHPFEKLFVCLKHCAEELMTPTTSIPFVHFDNLLRWRDLSLLVGEDTLTIPAVSFHDVINNREGRNLLWPNTLGHDNNRIN